MVSFFFFFSFHDGLCSAFFFIDCMGAITVIILLFMTLILSI